MAYGEDETSGSKQKWIEDTHEARRDAIGIRNKIPPELVRTPVHDPPELVDYYNRLVHQYASQIRPKSGALRDMWEREVATVRVPRDGESVDIGMADAWGEVDTSGAIAQLPTDDRPVSCAALRAVETGEWDWATASFRYTVRYTDPAGGPGEIHDQKKVFLPVFALDRIMDVLNECLDELGWIPDQTMRDYEEQYAL